MHPGRAEKLTIQFSPIFEALRMKKARGMSSPPGKMVEDSVLKHRQGKEANHFLFNL